MRTITFANPKGGSGKTTSAMLLAEQIYNAGGAVAILDCDPNQHILRWAELRAENGRAAPFLVQPTPKEDAFLESIETLRNDADYLLIDLEGTASQLVTYAISRSDLVLIPFEPTPMEARQAARAVQLVLNIGRMLKRNIAHALLFTRVNAAFRTSDERDVRKETFKNGIPALETSIVRRAPYTRIFREASLLRELYDEVGQRTKGKSPSQQERALKPLETAIVNARNYAQEVVNLLQARKEAI